jgi:hypothetical protein
MVANEMTNSLGAHLKPSISLLLFVLLNGDIGTEDRCELGNTEWM